MLKRTLAGLALATASIGGALAADPTVEASSPQRVYIVPATTETFVFYVLEEHPREPYALVDRYNP